MALSVDFSVQQIPGSPGDIVFNDLSTGVDAAVVTRRIFIQAVDGDYVVIDGTTTEYEVWADFPATTSITLEDILTEDISARVVVQWLNVGGTVLYDDTQYVGLTCFNEDFDYELTQNVTGNQLLINDNNFWKNKLLLQNYIDSGDKAIERYSDIVSAQKCYSLATELRLSKQYYFNQNS